MHAVAKSCKLGHNDNVTDYEKTPLQAVEGISWCNGIRIRPQHASVVMRNISGPLAKYVMEMNPIGTVNTISSSFWSTLRVSYWYCWSVFERFLKYFWRVLIVSWGFCGSLLQGSWGAFWVSLGRFWVSAFWSGEATCLAWQLVFVTFLGCVFSCFFFLLTCRYAELSTTTAIT